MIHFQKFETKKRENIFLGLKANINLFTGTKNILYPIFNLIMLVLIIHLLKL